MGEIVYGCARDVLCSALLILGRVLPVKRLSVLSHLFICYPFYLVGSLG